MWNANSENDVASYSVYGGETSNPGTPIHSTDITEAEVFLAGYADGTMYYFRITATDISGNESDVSNEIAGIPQAVQVTAVSPPATDILDEQKKEIRIKFGQPLTSVGSVAISSPGLTSIAHTLNYDPTDTSAVLVFTDKFAAADTLNITLSGVTDWAGQGRDPIELTFMTYILADYNNDRVVDITDLSQLLGAWASDDYAFEIAPVTGKVPHFVPSPDGVFDLRDIMAFARSWTWSHQQSVAKRALLAVGGVQGVEPVVVYDGNRMQLIMPANTAAGQLMITSQRDDLTVTQMQTLNSLVLGYRDPESNENLIEFAYFDKPHAINVELGGHYLGPFEIELEYRLYDRDQNLIGAGTKQITVAPIPIKYALHQNYPNPFNPASTIRFDLPEATAVSLNVYDIRGRLIAKLVEGEYPAGYHRMIWTARDNAGRNIPSGIYIARLVTPEYVKTIKMVLLK